MPLPREEAAALGHAAARLALVAVALLALRLCFRRCCPRRWRLHPALRRAEGVESLRWWGGARILYAVGWLGYRANQQVRCHRLPFWGC